MKILTAHVKLFRPLNLFIGAFSVFISSAILKSLYFTQELSLAILTVIFYNAGANSLNDFIDQKIDQLNRPNRPLPSKAVSSKYALISSIILFISGSISVLFLSVDAKIIALFVVLPLIIVYNIKLKKLPLIGNAIISAILGLTFLFSGAVFGNMNKMLIPCFLAFGLTFVREIIKDIEDIAGDQLEGVSTFPIIAGLNKAKNLTVILAILIGFGSLLPYSYGIYSLWYLIFLILGVEIPLVMLVVLIMKSPSKKTYSFLSKLLKVSIVFGIFAIYFGSIYE